MSVQEKARRPLVLLLVGLWSLAAGGQDKTDRWKAWLEEVDPIITKNERSVFKALKT
ncbi:MAG: hypothetical protein H6P98_1964, partial [Candidatus Aminicenantes bacterium]|nr:hypothetical protein [Candidatus Aminicenantes bacterium]